MRIWQCQKPIKIGNRHFGANTIIALNAKTGIVSVCGKFPRKYAGSNPWLPLQIYDPLWESWDFQNEKSDLTRQMRGVFCQNGKKQPQHIDVVSVQALMQPQTKPRQKGSGSGRRLNPYMEKMDCGQNTPRFKEVTECAHWAHLADNNSGNASIVACSIK